MTSKTHLIRVLKIILFLLGFCLLSNALVDPYKIWNLVSIEGINGHQVTLRSKLPLAKIKRVQKLNAQMPEYLILGSSRALRGIDPEHPAWPSDRVFNLSMAGLSVNELLLYLKYAQEVQPLKAVVLGADFFSFNIFYRNNSQKEVVDPSLQAAKNKFQNRIQLSTTFNSLKHSLLTIRKQESKATRSIIYPKGRTAWVNFEYKVKAYKGFRRLFRKLETVYVHFYLPKPWMKYQFQNDRGKSTWTQYQDILKFCHSNGIVLYVFISPAHAHLLTLIDELGLWSEFESWKENLVAHNVAIAGALGAQPFPIWDFSGYNAITTEAVPLLDDADTRMQNYLDPSHYKKEIGDLILDKVLGGSTQNEDFGRRLTPQTLDTVLEEIRRGREKYRQTFPDDIQEIHDLARDTLRAAGTSLRSP